MKRPDKKDYHESDHYHIALDKYIDYLESRLKMKVVIRKDLYDAGRNVISELGKLRRKWSTVR